MFAMFVFMALVSSPVEVYSKNLHNDNSTYCHIWRITGQKVVGADYQQMDSYCKSIDA